MLVRTDKTIFENKELGDLIPLRVLLLKSSGSLRTCPSAPLHQDSATPLSSRGTPALHTRYNMTL